MPQRDTRVVFLTSATPKEASSALNTGPLTGGSFTNFEKFTAATLIAVAGDIFVFGGSEGGDFVRGQNGTLLGNQAVAFEDLLSGRGGTFQSGELAIREQGGERAVPASLFTRWSSR